MPRVSIILPTYNWAKYIAHAIESVCKQTYTDYEFLIINDSSTDTTEDIILQYTKEYPKILYIKNKKKLGLVKTLNKGLHIAKGEYIARIDDDDERIDIGKLKKQVIFLDEHPEYGLVWTSAININENGKEIGKYSPKKTDQEIRKNILISNQFYHSSVLIKKLIIDIVWWYDERLLYVEDYNLWLRIWKISKMHNLSDYAIRYMIRIWSISSSNQRTQKWNSIKIGIKYINYYPNGLHGVLSKLINLFLHKSWIRYPYRAIFTKNFDQKD